MNGQLYVNKTWNVGTGDKIDIFQGRFINYSVAGANNQIDGTITMNGMISIAFFFFVLMDRLARGAAFWSRLMH